MGKNTNTRYKSWSIQYNYDYDTRDGEGQPKNPDPSYFKDFDGKKVIEFKEWLEWRTAWLKQKILLSKKDVNFVIKAVKKGYPDLLFDTSDLEKSVAKTKTKDQKFGIIIGSKHDLDTKLSDDKKSLVPKQLHMHAEVILDSAITMARAIKFFQPSRDANLQNITKRAGYTRYLLHASESAFDAYKYDYGEDHIILSNLPNFFYTHCVYHYLAQQGKTKDSKKAQKQNADDLAATLNDKISAGQMTVDDAINIMKLEFGSSDLDDYRSTFKNNQADWLRLLFNEQKQHGRNFDLQYINGLGHAGKSDLAEAIPKACSPYHRYFPTTMGGARKTTDIANGWQGEPFLVIQEMDGYAEDFRTLASIFDPNHVSMASSRNSNVQLAIDGAFISNSAPESKWIIDNLVSHSKYEKNDTRTAIFKALRLLDLTPDELTHLTEMPLETLKTLLTGIPKSDADDAEAIDLNEALFELRGSKYSTSDSMVDWCVQLVRRLTYNIHIYTPHKHFTYDGTKPYRQAPLNIGDPIDEFNLNQRITEVHKLSELDKYLENHNDLFSLPHLPHKPEDDGYFLEPNPDAFEPFENKLTHITCKNLALPTLESFSKDTNYRKNSDYLGRVHKMLLSRTVPIHGEKLLSRIREALNGLQKRGDFDFSDLHVNEFAFASYLEENNYAEHLLSFDASKLGKDTDLDFIKHLLSEDENKNEFSYSMRHMLQATSENIQIKKNYEQACENLRASNLKLQRVARYNLALASCPLFSDDPENDTIILVQRFDARINRMVTGCAIGLSHCPDYDEYRKNVEKAGIAIAKVEGKYQPEADDYIDPAEVRAKLVDIAQNGAKIADGFDDDDEKAKDTTQTEK